MPRLSLEQLAEEVQTVLRAAPGPITHQELSAQISQTALANLRNLVRAGYVHAEVITIGPDQPARLQYSLPAQQ